MDSLLLGILAVQLQLAKLSLERMQPVAEAAIIEPHDFAAYASTVADEYGINKDQFLSTLQSEGGWKNGQSNIKDARGPNGREDSWGCAQIHLPAHPDITKEEAQDCVWSIRWAAIQFKLGKEYMWTQWRLQYGRGST